MDEEAYEICRARAAREALPFEADVCTSDALLGIVVREASTRTLLVASVRDELILERALG